LAKLYLTLAVIRLPRSQSASMPAHDCSTMAGTSLLSLLLAPVEFQIPARQGESPPSSHSSARILSSCFHYALLCLISIVTSVFWRHFSSRARRDGEGRPLRAGGHLRSCGLPKKLCDSNQMQSALSAKQYFNGASWCREVDPRNSRQVSSKTMVQVTDQKAASDLRTYRSHEQTFTVFSVWLYRLLLSQLVGPGLSH